MTQSNRMMTKYFSVIAIIISLAVIGNHITGLFDIKSDLQVVESVVGFTTPLGLDSDGYPGTCTSDGIAQNLSRKGGFEISDTRYKDGVPMRCMNRQEARDYMASLGANDLTIGHILDQYPLFEAE